MRCRKSRCVGVADRGCRLGVEGSGGGVLLLGSSHSSASSFFFLPLAPLPSSSPFLCSLFSLRLAAAGRGKARLGFTRVEAEDFIGGQLGFGARRRALQGTDAEDCRRWLGGAHRGTWRASQGCVVRSARVPFTRKGGQERWPTAGGARQAVTRAGSAGVRGGEKRGRSKAKSRAERAVFTQVIGERGDARSGQAASARCHGAARAGDASAGQAAPARGAKAEQAALLIWGRKRNRRAPTGGAARSAG